MRNANANPHKGSSRDSAPRDTEPRDTRSDDASTARASTDDAGDPDLPVRLATAEERQRLARVLHDDIQQRLYSLRIRLFTVRDAVRQGEPLPAGLAGELDAVDALLLDTILATRGLTSDLTAQRGADGSAKGASFRDALNELGAQMLLLHGMDVDVECSDDGTRPAGPVIAAVVHVLRELLFNVVKHAGVSRARVRASILRNDLIVEVEDEGRGFAEPSDGEGAAAEGGFGLHDARACLQRLGGEMRIVSAPGVGTSVRIQVPPGDAGRNAQ